MWSDYEVYITDLKKQTDKEEWKVCAAVLVGWCSFSDSDFPSFHDAYELTKFLGDSYPLVHRWMILEYVMELLWKVREDR